MYTNFRLNQASVKEKSKTPTVFSSKSSPTIKFSGDISSYISSLTKKQKQIAAVFTEFTKATRIKLTNAYIVSRTGCSVKTVTRATNKFHADGFITKHQDNPYAPNHYKFNEKAVKGPKAFEYFFNKLTPTQQDLWTTNGILVDHKNKLIVSPRNVPQNYSLLSVNSLSNKTGTVKRAYARNVPVLKKEARKINGEYSSMKPEQRKWILSHRNDPRVKEMLLTDERVKAALFTPEMLKISELLSLDERERLKMIAFPKESIRYALEYIASVVSGRKTPKKPVDDRLGWLVGILSSFCTKNNVKPDWSWYFDIAEISGQKYDSTNEPKKPLFQNKPKTLTENKRPKEGMYSVWQSPKKDPIEVRIEKLRTEIAKNEERLATHTTADYMLDFLRNRILPEQKQELSELEAEHERTIAQS